jgi:hypothetical protein
MGGGRSAGTWITPRPSTRQAMALASTVPGLRSRPPQLPLWWPPSRSVSDSSKLATPREPRKTVARSRDRRGPSLAISTSAASASRCAAQNVARPGEPVSSPVSISQVTLKPSRPRTRQHLRQRGDVDAVLALVVGGAAAVQAVAVGRHGPRALAAGPRRVLAADHVAVAVHQHRGQRRVLDTAADQQRAVGRFRVGVDRGRETQRGQRRGDLVGQVALQLGARRRVLAFGADGHAAGQVAQEGAAVEVRARGGQRVVSRVGAVSEVSCASWPARR